MIFFFSYLEDKSFLNEHRFSNYCSTFYITPLTHEVVYRYHIQHNVYNLSPTLMLAL